MFKSKRRILPLVLVTLFCMLIAGTALESSYGRSSTFFSFQIENRTQINADDADYKLISVYLR